jgi:energy-coupling factor transporter ATP-binding protein EcfA2
MARTQQQIRNALENCTVAPREAAAAVISDAAKSKPEKKKQQEVDSLSEGQLPRLASSSGT